MNLSHIGVNSRKNCRRSGNKYVQLCCSSAVKEEQRDVARGRMWGLGNLLKKYGYTEC